MSDDMQVHLSARDDLSATLERVIDLIGRLEHALRGALGSTGSGAERDVERLGRELDDAQDQARELGREIDRTDAKIDRLGGTSHRTAGGVDSMGRGSGTAAAGMAGMAGKANAAAIAVAAVAAATMGASKAFMEVNSAVGLFQQNTLKSKAVFKGQIDEMRKWARAHRADFGGSTQDVLNYATSLQDLIVPMGFGRKQATSMTKDFASLVPVLTAWDKSGRSAAEITDIMSAALTGEREELKSLGVTISQDMVDAQIELMRSQGKLKGATDEQASALATMELLYQKTGDAQKSYADNSDTVARRSQRLKADLAEVRDAGLKVLLKVWNRVTAAFRDAGFGGGLKKFASWLNANSDRIVSAILRIVSAVARLSSWWQKLQSVVYRAIGYLVGGIAKVLRWMSWLDPRFKGAADQADALARGFGKAGDAAGESAKRTGKLADELWNQADQASASQAAMDKYRASLDGATEAQKRYLRANRDIIVQNGGNIVPLAWPPAGDTGGSWGVGDPGALPAAHALLPGHTITSATRGHRLGSDRSDHRHGRALDVTGPRLPDYAASVRAAGGYAAFHGAGSGRHLHVVPRTAHNANASPVSTSTYNVHVEVHHPATGLDVSAEVAAGLRRAARESEERG